jgi:YHS domain-containing protein
MRNLSRRALLMIAMAAGVGHALGPWRRVRAESPSRTALWGYDPVSYFTAGHPEAGSAEFTFAFDDATYWFASEEHRKMFAADPERYAPQFKGYCAASVARGLKIEADPEAFAIWNGKLFVFGSKDSVPEFKANPGEIANKANEIWTTLKAN